MQRQPFDGWITAFGTPAGHRFVAGIWARSPFGPFADVMWAHPDGHQSLLAPSPAIADFIRAFYRYDDVRVVPVAVKRVGGSVAVDAGPVHLLVTPGNRGLVGALLAVVPRPIGRSTAWAALVDLPARRLLPGVRTRGVGPGGRRQWYCALDHRPLTAAAAWLDGEHLGAGVPIDPPVTFGFSSTPAQPSWVRVVSVIETDARPANVAR